MNANPPNHSLEPSRVLRDRPSQPGRRIRRDTGRGMARRLPFPGAARRPMPLGKAADSTQLQGVLDYKHTRHSGLALILSHVITAAACSAAPALPTVPPRAPPLPPAWTPTASLIPSSAPFGEPSTFPQAPTETPRPFWIPCADSRPSRLRLGDIAVVSLEPDLPNRLRTAPGLQEGSVVGQISPGDKVELIDGPSCADKMVWWRVRTVETGIIAWTAEGNREAPWLIPQGIPTPATVLD